MKTITKEVQHSREVSYLKAMTKIFQMIGEDDKVIRILIAKQVEDYIKEMI
jgi:hypothetical protein